MKIGIISDIHANLPALNAVLSHAGQNNVDIIYNLGDSIGYGAYPDQVIKFLISEKITSILGNYDHKVLEVKKKANKWSKKKNPLKLFAFQWTFEQLSSESIAFLKTLPESIYLNHQGFKILLVHGSPASIDEPITEKTTVERLSALAVISEADIVLCGHSHQAFFKQRLNTIFINPGSVGRQNDGDPRTSYAILNIGERQISIQHFRIPYDLFNTLLEINKQELPEEFALMTLYGYDLNKIQKFMQTNESISTIENIW